MDVAMAFNLLKANGFKDVTEEASTSGMWQMDCIKYIFASPDGNVQYPCMDDESVIDLAEWLHLEEGMFTVLCIFDSNHMRRAKTPQEAHDLMERHYAEKHRQQIDRICGKWSQQ